MLFKNTQHKIEIFNVSPTSDCYVFHVLIWCAYFSYLNQPFSVAYFIVHWFCIITFRKSCMQFYWAFDNGTLLLLSVTFMIEVIKFTWKQKKLENWCSDAIPMVAAQRHTTLGDTTNALIFGVQSPIHYLTHCPSSPRLSTTSGWIDWSKHVYIPAPFQHLYCMYAQHWIQGQSTSTFSDSSSQPCLRDSCTLTYLMFAPTADVSTMNFIGFNHRYWGF